MAVTVTKRPVALLAEVVVAVGFDVSAEAKFCLPFVAKSTVAL